MTMGSRTSPEDGLLSLKWNNHRSTFLHILTGLRDKPLHSDVTLACSGELFPVHKLVLSSCSTYFATMFASTHCQHPVIVLKDIHKDELEALLDYMYIGEVDVKQSALEPLIRAAECLHIKGLAAPDEELPATRGTPSAGRGNSGGGDRRSTASNSNQQQQANCVGASSRGSKRGGGGTNSGPSDDEDAVEGPCSTVIKRRRRGSCSSPGGVGAENVNSSSVTSVSVSYSSLSRGSRARGALESTPLQHSSSVIPNRDNVRTTSLDDPRSRVNQQQTPSKSASHQQSQHNTHQSVIDVTEHVNRSGQHDARHRQPAASPVTSEGSSYGGASTFSQLLPSQVIKVELDDDRGGGGGVEEDEPREAVVSSKQPLSKERMDIRGINHGEEIDNDNQMYSESLNSVKVEEEELEGRNRQVEGVASSSKAEAESRPPTDWSGGDGGGEDRSSAPLGDDNHESTPKGPWHRGGNGGGREDARGGSEDTRDEGNVSEFLNKNSSSDEGGINVPPYLHEDQEDEVREEKYEPHLEDDIPEGDPRSNITEEEYYEEEDEDDDDISVLRDDARVTGNNQLLSRTVMDSLQSLGLAGFPQHHLSDSSSSKLNFSSSLSQLLEASLENASAPLVPLFEPYEEGFRLGSSSNFSQERAFSSNLSAGGQWRSGSNRSISIKRGLQATTSPNSRPAKLSAAPEHRPRHELHSLSGLALQMSPSSSVTISGAPPPLPPLHALPSSARDSQRTPTQHHHQMMSPGSLLSPPSSRMINLSSNQSSNLGHLASPTFRDGNHHHHQARPQQRQVSPSDGGSAADGPLYCPFCGKLCKRRDHLRVHIRIHTGEKPFQCPYCDRRTNQKNNLKLHIRNVHPGLSANV